MDKLQLTAKQERFCQEYVIDLNGTQAAIRTGYSEKTANEQSSRLLTNVNIQQRIKELQDNIANKLGITAEWVTQRFKEISDRCMTAEPVFDKLGNPTGEYIFDSTGANKSTEMLGKMIGVFEKDNTQKAVILPTPSINVYGNTPETH